MNRQPQVNRWAAIALLATIISGVPISSAVAEEIKIGQTMPYSGPLSAVGTIGTAHSAYFEMVNAEKGGINGKAVKLISLDDAYSPPKTLEQTRKLIGRDNVLLIFGSVGTATNIATRKLLNDAGVPQILLTTGANGFNDPKSFKWTMPWLPSYGMEARIYGSLIKRAYADAKIAVLYQNDDYGKSYFDALCKVTRRLTGGSG